MSVVFMKQENYKFPTDEIFEIGFIDTADFSFANNDFFNNYIGKEISGPDGKKYIIHSIMKDVITEKIYALCQEAIQQKDLS